MEPADPSEAGATLYQDILDALPHLVFVVDADLRVLLINQTFLNALPRLGLRGSPVGRFVEEAFPFLPKSVRPEIEHVFARGEPVFSETRAEVAGAPIVVETVRVPLLDASGSVWAVANLVRDVTRRAEELDRMRREWEQAEMLFETAPASLVVLDREAKILRCNRAAWQGAHGVGPESLVGRNALEFIDPADRPTVLQGIVEARPEGEPVVGRVRYRWDDGVEQTGWFAANRVPRGEEFPGTEDGVRPEFIVMTAADGASEPAEAAPQGPGGAGQRPAARDDDGEAP